MLAELQTEIGARIKAPNALPDQIAENEELRNVSAEATRALDDLIAANVRT
jgi:hypothetical protein